MKFVLVELVWKPLQGRAPQGARGLKFWATVAISCRIRRAPQGARGLK